MTAFQRINRNGTTYQTRWPMHAFRAFLNVELGEGGRSIVSRKVWCPHCQNGGVVILDASTCDGVACPMCAVGKLHNIAWRMNRFEYDSKGGPTPRGELPMESWCWRPSDDLSQWSWNNGLSIDHTAVCGACKERAALPGRECSGCQRKREQEQGVAA
jgi:hypothetical protein